MTLLERYLEALRPLLPRKTANDILREIADEIESQMEDKAEAFGRPLTEEEQSDIIRKHGHPVVVAARYGQPRYLIGPELFPFYWRTLRISMVVALAIWAVIISVTVLSSAEPGREWMPQLLRIPGVLITIFGVLTALFAAGQRFRPFTGSKLEARWNPRSLPDRGRESAHRAQRVAEIVLGIIGLLWWQLVPSMQFLALGPAAYFLKLGPVWETLHWPVLILIAASICKSALRLIWPERALLHARFALLLDAAELVLLLVALRSGDWVTVQPALARTGHFGAVADALNRILSIGCFISLLIRAVQFVFKSIRYWRDSAPQSSAGSLSAI